MRQTATVQKVENTVILILGHIAHPYIEGTLKDELKVLSLVLV